jgi:hypothetical protein
LANTDGFYIDKDVQENLKAACKIRGDKSRIINEALRQYFLPKQEFKPAPSGLKITKVIMN